MRKYIFVTGGAVSDYGKTTVAASVGLLLSSRGFNVKNKKLNACVNIGVGSLNPAQCGEIFTADDGTEADLSLGFYERFTGEKQNEDSFFTAGKAYWSVINKERMGSFMGETATVSYHVANEINNFICGGSGDVVIAEIGGTVGDVESVHFLDAIGKIKEIKGEDNVIYIHVENIPDSVESEEEKLSPVSRSLSALVQRGIYPDVVVCRTAQGLESDFLAKISVLCNLSKESVIECRRTDILYEVPLELEKNGLSVALLKHLCLQDFKPALDSWKAVISKMQKAEKEVKISLVGKYASLRGAYQSVKEALDCAAAENNVKVSINWIPSDEINEKNMHELLDGSDGIILPDGKGRGGTDGMICAAAYARKNDIPFLAIGQGMHMAVVEFAASCLGLKGAGSTELCDTPYPVVTETDACSGEKRIKTTRGTKIFSSYGRELFYERCRHKYIVNGAYREKLEEAGMYFTAKTAEEEICQAVEVSENRFFVGVQFSPEFTSTPIKVNPLFISFVKEASE